ncbi:VOC family protein [Vibrio sp. 10N.261.55.A7]|uniref:VOC family protein n=1 Tax=Vibrio sp. 10N.261.55.A7 TaxID=1880851 RepID=UPI000C84AA97|nr:VOC family protein [Vibrio sp. 10N.261.55.A7]PMJ91544.1 glyoxalase [Vibrio sp. 10N.261.55.A7]
MKNLEITEIKSFVPAKDFQKSKDFYQAIGFELASEFDGIVYFKKGHCAFLLQDFYVAEHSDNFMMHLLVEDARSWYEHIKEADVIVKFDASLSEPVEQPWGMLDFCLTDPSGVLWRIGQNI